MVSNMLHGRIHQLLDVLPLHPKSDFSYCIYKIIYIKSICEPSGTKLEPISLQGFCISPEHPPVYPSHDVGHCLESEGDAVLSCLVRVGSGCVVLSCRETGSPPLMCHVILQCFLGLHLHLPGNLDGIRHEIEICDFCFVHTISIKLRNFRLVWKRCH